MFWKCFANLQNPHINPGRIAPATIWHTNFYHPKKISLGNTFSTSPLKSFIVKKTVTDLSFGRQLDHRFPKVKFGVGVSHFFFLFPAAVSSCWQGPLIISLITAQSAAQLVHSGTTRTISTREKRVILSSSFFCVFFWGGGGLQVKSEKRECCTKFHKTQSDYKQSKWFTHNCIIS